tara:strand:+ start:6634 stop:7065 length:432 start_codon:yes stop_codon:yes gene_type:complete
MRYSEFIITKKNIPTTEELPIMPQGQGMTRDTDGKDDTAGSGPGTPATAVKKAKDKVVQQLVKPGSSIPMPTQNGQEDFEIDDVDGEMVTLINPNARKAPEEPEKISYLKKDIDTIVKGLDDPNSNTPNAKGPEGTLGNQGPK